MLKDAALLHLDLMAWLIPRGFWLRDASAFNVQNDGKRLCLIDTLSIGRRTPDSAWVAYGQFCSHFLAPLALAARCDIRLLGLWRNHIDGFPLDLAARMLPTLSRFKPGLLMHLVLHSRFQQNSDTRQDLGRQRKAGVRRVSDAALLRIVQSLHRTVIGLKCKIDSRIWTSYESVRVYDERQVEQKKNFVREVVGRVDPQTVWDLGGNTGEFSIIAGEKGAFVVSIDGDPGCTEYLYQKVSRDDDLDGILPLTMDLANPTPGLGWESHERMSLMERGPADLCLALALIHHLVLSSNIPMYRVAKWLANIAKNLIIEFVPTTDPMVQKLILNRELHLPYSLDEFNARFGEHFDFVEKAELENQRVLFFCRSKAK